MLRGGRSGMELLVTYVLSHRFNLRLLVLETRVMRQKRSGKLESMAGSWLELVCGRSLILPALAKLAVISRGTICRTATFSRLY